MLCGFFIPGVGQVGGNSTYSFLGLPNSARSASLGGKSIAISDDDLNMPFNNPSLLNREMDNHFVLNYIDYFAGIRYGYVSYAKDYAGLGTFAAGIQYINYGEFIAANDLGYKTGTFSASDYAVNIIFSRQTDDSLFSYGITFKPVYSHLERYNSFGILFDGGVTYHHPDRFFTASLVVKNFGTQLVTYYGGKKEKMPFEIQAGISQRLSHAPFRFSVMLQHLEKPDMSYTSEIGTNSDYLGEEPDKNKFGAFGDQFMRHVIVGVEFLPAENFYLNAGYNYQRRKELQIPGRVGMTGFSWGLGVRIKKIHISYGRARYHVAGASDHFSISFDFNEIYTRK